MLAFSTIHSRQAEHLGDTLQQDYIDAYQPAIVGASAPDDRAERWRSHSASEREIAENLGFEYT